MIHTTLLCWIERTDTPLNCNPIWMSLILFKENVPHTYHDCSQGGINFNASRETRCHKLSYSIAPTTIKCDILLIHNGILQPTTLWLYLFPLPKRQPPLGNEPIHEEQPLNMNYKWNVVPFPLPINVPWILPNSFSCQSFNRMVHVVAASWFTKH